MPGTGTMRECSACALEQPIDSFPSFDGCDHLADTCEGCLGIWIATLLESPLNDMRCPSDRCRRELTSSDLQGKLTKALMERLGHHETLKVWIKGPDFRWYLNPQCNFGQFQDDTGRNILTYSECGFRTCVTCDVCAHDGQTCAQYQKLHGKSKEDVASEEAINRQAKQCPKCGVAIQKRYGCYRMTCTQCSCRFCYLCRAEYIGLSNERISHQARCRMGRVDMLEGMDRRLAEVEMRREARRREQKCREEMSRDAAIFMALLFLLLLVGSILGLLLAGC